MTTSGEEEEDIAGGDDGGNEDEGRDVHMLDTQPVLMLGRGERGWERGEGGEVRTGRWCERDSSPTNPIVPHPLSAPPSPPPHPEDEIYMAATQVSSTISGVDTTTAGAAGLGGDVAAPSPAIGLPDAAISPGGAQAAEAPPPPPPTPAPLPSPVLHSPLPLPPWRRLRRRHKPSLGPSATLPPPLVLTAPPLPPVPPSPLPLPGGRVIGTSLGRMEAPQLRSPVLPSSPLPSSMLPPPLSLPHWGVLLCPLQPSAPSPVCGWEGRQGDIGEMW